MTSTGVLEVDYSDTTPTVTHTCDDRGSIDTRADASGPTDYGHDPLGRLTSRTHTATPASCSCDKAGNDTDRVSDLSYSYASPGTAACAGAPATGADTALRWRSMAMRVMVSGRGGSRR